MRMLLQKRISTHCVFLSRKKITDKNTCIRITGLHQTEVCSAPRPYLTLFELVSEVIEAVSLFFGFFKLDLSGPLLVLLPAKKSLVLTMDPEFNSNGP